MTNFALVNSLLKSVMLMVLPIAGMMLVFYSVYQLWRDLRNVERKKIRERLRDEKIRKKTEELEQSLLRKVNQPKIYEQVLERLSIARKLQCWIEQGDLDISGSKLLVRLLLGAVVLFALMFVFKLRLWLTIGVPAAVLVLPVFVIRFLARRRMKKLVYQLPEVFELISQALRAGHSLASGISLVGKQLPDPSGTEFARVFHEQNLGITVENALKHFADRVDQLDVRLFVTAILIQRQTGGDLAEVLDKIGSVIRGRITIMGQVKALTAEGRMSGWVLCALPPFVFFLAWMLNPQYAGILLYEREGQCMLAAAIFFQLIGMLMIKKIVNIKI